MVVDTSSAAIGANVNIREVGTLLLNGRQLYLLAPGAQTAGGGSLDNIRFSGRANQEDAVRFDGVEASSIIDASSTNLNGEVSTGSPLQNSLDNIAEFRVDSSKYPAEDGTSGSDRGSDQIRRKMRRVAGSSSTSGTTHWTLGTSPTGLL